MLSAFIDRLGGIFDNRFIVAYWVPAFIALALLGSGIATFWGFPNAATWWLALNAVEQAWLGGALLLTITVLAYLLQVLTNPLIRLYEGYSFPLWLATRSRKRQKRVMQALKKRPEDYQKSYTHFPRDDARIRPTSLGNVLTAAEEYSFQLYSLDAILWWPRLIPLLSEAFMTQISATLTPLLALINLSAITSVAALVSLIFLFFGIHLWWIFLLASLACLFLSWICYRAAVTQALSYGNIIRIAFDLYRHEILKAMHISIPDNLADERELWAALNQWVYYYIPPWDSLPAHNPAPTIAAGVAGTTSSPDSATFYYDIHTQVVDKTQHIHITLDGVPTLTLNEQKSDKQ